MPTADETALRVLTKLRRVPEMVAARLQDLAPPDGDATPLQAWLAAYRALDAIDREIGELIEEAWEELHAARSAREPEIVNSGPAPGDAV